MEREVKEGQEMKIDSILEQARLEPDDADAILAIALLAAAERQRKRERRQAKALKERKLRQALRRARREAVSC